MSYQSPPHKSLIILIFVILKAILTVQQGQVCTLPDGNRQSTCIRFHLCDSFKNIMRQYNGRPPQSEIQNINAHVCASGGYFCCPDSAVLIATTPASQPNDPNGDLPSTRANYSTLQTSPNFNLINEKACGITNLSRTLMPYAEISEFPWTALLGFSSRLEDGTIDWKCGGTLIAEQFVLTAAHCINGDLFLVRLGEHNIATSKDCNEYYEYIECADPVQDIAIEKKIKHPKYNRAKKINDIALLKLSTPADTTKNNVRTICLPVEEEDDLEKIVGLKRQFIISGWGSIGDGNFQRDSPLRAVIPYFEKQDCVEKYAQFSHITIHPTHFCAGYNHAETCAGDPGSGIIAVAANKTREKFMHYGVESPSANCQNLNEKFPGIYTNIQFYLDWILESMS